MHIRFFPNMIEAARAELGGYDHKILTGAPVEIRDESHAMQWSIFCDNASNHTDDPETKRNFRAQAAMLRNAKFEPDHRVLIYQVNEALECAKSAAYRLTTGDYSGAAAQLQDIRYNLNQWNENLPDETRVSEV